MRRARFAALAPRFSATLLLVSTLIACQQASTDPGSAAWLRVAGAQYVPASLPAADGGPEIVALSLADGTIFAGAIDRPLLGTLPSDATAAAIGLRGDRGYFLVPAGIPDTETPTLPSLSARLSFSLDLPPGEALLLVSAVDARGRFGPPRSLALSVAPAPPPSGRLLFRLAWPDPVDLDLHVVEPSGAEVWAGARSADGAIDVDVSSQCAVGGLGRETIRYPLEAPPGRYLVRVDTFSLCARTQAAWFVDVFVDGAWRTGASGIASEADTRGPHGQGAGLLALELELP